MTGQEHYKMCPFILRYIERESWSFMRSCIIACFRGKGGMLLKSDNIRQVYTIQVNSVLCAL